MGLRSVLLLSSPVVWFSDLLSTCFLFWAKTDFSILGFHVILGASISCFQYPTATFISLPLLVYCAMLNDGHEGNICGILTKMQKLRKFDEL